MVAHYLESYDTKTRKGLQADGRNQHSGFVIVFGAEHDLLYFTWSTQMIETSSVAKTIVKSDSAAILFFRER